MLAVIMAEGIMNVSLFFTLKILFNLTIIKIIASRFSSDSSRGYGGGRSYDRGGGGGGPYNNTESTDWQKAAEAWANRSKGTILV